MSEQPAEENQIQKNEQKLQQNQFDQQSNEQQEDPEENMDNNETSKKKKQADLFKKYIEQTGIAMAFQVIFAEILDKKIQESKVYTYTAMRLRQIGQDLEKIKLSKK